MSEYTPTEADVRGIYVEYYMRHTGRLHSHTEAESCGYNLIGPEGLDHYIRREHPEEAA